MPAPASPSFFGHTPGRFFDLASGRSYAADELLGEVKRRSQAFASSGLRPGDAVLLRQANGADFFLNLLALWRNGATAVCLDPAGVSDEVSQAWSDTHARFALGKPVREWPAGVLPLDALAVTEAKLPPEGEAEARAALVLFSSGSAGTPKAVLLPWTKLAQRLRALHAAIPPADTARTLCFLPVHFGHGLISNCLFPWFRGGDLFLAPVFSAETCFFLAQWIDEHQITFVSGVPTIWQTITELAAPPAGGSLRRMHSASAFMPADSWEAIARWGGPGAAVYNCYGITETSSWIAGGRAWPREGMADGFVGQPWGATFRLTSERDEGGGEILVETPALFSGYLREGRLDSSAVATGYFPTGDYGRFDEAGNLVLTGRRSAAIHRAGNKCQPEEVAALLGRHPSVSEAFVFGIPDRLLGQEIGAAVVLREGASVNAQELDRWCREQMNKHRVPGRWFFLPALPKTARGKLDGSSIRARCLGSPA